LAIEKRVNLRLFSVKINIEVVKASYRKNFGATLRSNGGKEVKGMQDALNLVMLVCAAAAALAFGVLAAYVLCRVSFAVLRIHARSIAVPAPQPKPEVARP
jgi:ABC-type sulfate transport system permease component